MKGGRAGRREGGPTKGREGGKPREAERRRPRVESSRRTRADAFRFAVIRSSFRSMGRVERMKIGWQYLRGE